MRFILKFAEEKITSIWPQVLVALFLASMAGLASFYISENKDYIFDWSWYRPRGSYQNVIQPKLVSAARDFAEARHPGEACVAMPLGRDEFYLFLAIGCARYSEKSETNLLPARARYRGDEVVQLEIPPKETHPNSIRRIMPATAFEKMRYGFPHTEILEAGISRMREKGI